MKRFVFVAVSAALFVSGISAFAYGRGPDMTGAVNDRSSGSSFVSDNQNRSGASIQEWVGKTVDQLVQQLGKPDFIDYSNSNDEMYTSAPRGADKANYATVSGSGDKIYGYTERATTRGRNDAAMATQLQFDIASDGVIQGAKSLAL